VVEDLGLHDVDPVLTVSLKTWPQVGFSRKRSIRPSSVWITMPNSRGSGTRARQAVTSAPVARCAATSAVRSMSVSASPEMTRKASSRRAVWALRTDPAVPSGLSSVAYDRCMPSSSPSPK
jgi:hypothetical protein